LRLDVAGTLASWNNVKHLPFSDATQAIDDMTSGKRADPINFEKNYITKFNAVFGSFFRSTSTVEVIELGKQLEQKLGLQPRGSVEKSHGINEGFGSDKFWICVVRIVDSILQAILADGHWRSSMDREIYGAAALTRSLHVQTTQCDARSLPLSKDSSTGQEKTQNMRQFI
jgi:hypothetical protein